MKRKPHIISASRRTDIPRFYSKWFMKRIRAGYCLVPNPFYPQQVSLVSLEPEDVAVIVFWSKNPKPLLKYLDKLDESGFKYYFLYTVNDYPKKLEPKMPALEARLETFRQLSEKLDKGKVVWRYDPLILDEGKLTPGFHLERFEHLCSQLKGHTKRCIISVIDLYPNQRTWNKLHSKGYELSREPLGDPKLQPLLVEMVSIAQKYSISEITSCAEAKLEVEGMKRGKCIDDVLIKDEFGIDVLGSKHASQRDECLCVPSVDIGMNHTCLNGCLYCYATSSLERAKENYSKHDRESPQLVGRPKPEDEAEAEAKHIARKADSRSKTKKAKRPDEPTLFD